jgi:hypothetical protein
MATKPRAVRRAHGVRPFVHEIATVTVSATSAPQHDGSLRWLPM